MDNYLTISQAANLAGLAESEFTENYLQNGRLSLSIREGNKTIELSELLRVFPNIKYDKYPEEKDRELELKLKQLKIENLEYQIVGLERQLSNTQEEHQWLKNKYDNTTLLLEQKLDTSELDKYKQEIRELSKTAVEWEKRYNTLLAANELKNVTRENNLLKAQIDEQQHKINMEKQRFNKLEEEIKYLNELAYAKLNSNEISEELELEVQTKKPKRRKLFGVF